MSATTLIPRPNTEDALFRTLIPIHDQWMSDADQTLEPMTRRDATFWQRWAAVNYLREEFPERLRLEQELLSELHAFLTAEVNERLLLQVERLAHLHQDALQLSQRRVTTVEMAGAVRSLLEALRLWYADVEFATNGIQRKDLGSRTTRVLNRLGQLLDGPRYGAELMISIA